MANWTAADIPDQSGRTALITGANSGLGLCSAIALASKGARVLLACRSPERGATALEAVRSAAPGSQIELVGLDLGDLASVRTAAAEIRASTGDSLHLAMLNAGVMYAPQGRTADGFELQLGINHFGHAALTWLLMPALRGVADARVVTVSSLAHRDPGFDLTDLDFTRRRYHPFRAYSQAKLANLLFAFELQRRADAAGLGLRSLAAHPGLSRTDLAGTGARYGTSKLVSAGLRLGMRIAGQSVARGALPQLYAATMPEVTGGQYWGPDGFRELRGSPRPVQARRLAHSEVAAAQLWELTAERTGVDPDPA